MKFLKNISSNNISGAGILALTLITANLLNFIFNAYLGRVLSFEDYGVVNLITSFSYLILVDVNALYATVNHKVAYLTSLKQNHEGYFYQRVLTKSLYISTAIALIWLIISPLISQYFHLASNIPVIVFAPVIISSLLSGVMKGYLQGKLLFLLAGLTFLIEPLSKLTAALILVLSRNNSLTYLAIPTSTLVTVAISYMFIKLKPVNLKTANYIFSSKFFLAAIITGTAGTAFLTLDVILAKHFLSPTEAGKYALLSLVGKIIYFFGTILNSLLITFVSRDEALHQNSSKLFLSFCGFTIFCSLVGFLILGLLGYLTVPILFGVKALALTFYLPLYTFSIGLFTVSSVFLSYHLAQHNYIFPIISVLLSILMIGGIFIYHNSILQIIQVIFGISSLNLLAMIILHFKKLSLNVFSSKELAS